MDVGVRLYGGSEEDSFTKQTMGCRLGRGIGMARGTGLALLT